MGIKGVAATSPQPSTPQIKDAAELVEDESFDFGDFNAEKNT